MANSPLTILKDYRAGRGITQEKLGEELGVTGVTVSRWETGARKVDDDKLSLVAEKTGLPRSELRPDLAQLLAGESAA